MLRRGRDVLPRTAPETRCLRCVRRTSLSLLIAAPMVGSFRFSCPSKLGNHLLGAGTGELLAELLLDDFADVTDTLTLVGFRLAKLADFRGQLADGLLIRAGDVD